MGRSQTQRVAFFLKTLATGGAQRVLLMIAKELAARGHEVDLVLVEKKGSMVGDISEKLNVVRLGTTSNIRTRLSLLRLPFDTVRLLLLSGVILHKLPEAIRAVARLEQYIRVRQPDAILTTLPANNLVTAWAASLSRVNLRVVVREANLLSRHIANTSGAFWKLIPVLVAKWYPQCSAVVPVSIAVGEDLSRVAAIPPQLIKTINNGVDLDLVGRLAKHTIDEPWLLPGEPPIVIAVGRLDPQKDYPTLLQAFSLARSEKRLRLLILGDGGEKSNLQKMSKELGICEDVRFLGFVDNPYPFIAHASVFVLSSRWEGFPNVLLEALACGCPIVSTDCNSGPAEILDHGRFGRLVPVGHVSALAQVILATLEQHPSRIDLRRRAAQFSISAVVDQYEEILFGH